MTRQSRTPDIVNDRRFVVVVIDDATAARYRKLTPAERVLIATAMNREVRSFLGRYVRNSYPDWSDAEVQREVLRMLAAASDEIALPIVITEK